MGLYLKIFENSSFLIPNISKFSNFPFKASIFNLLDYSTSYYAYFSKPEAKNSCHF